MILTCPNCGTQYVVKDDAIPPEGRQVRCAACKHSWHQDREQGAMEVEPEPIAAPEPPTEDEDFAEATMIEPRSGPEAEERAYEERVIEEGAEAPPADEPGEPGPGAAEDWNEPPHAEGAQD